ncbi:hypothetical protein BH11PLA2_BH11PLA2_32460 [soil metagenome]
MRPCHCGACHLCRLYTTDERYRRLWDSETVPVAAREPAPKVTLNCIHLDTDTVPGPDPRKRYRQCEKGHGLICGCDSPRKCGPGACGDYQAPPREAAR